MTACKEENAQWKSSNTTIGYLHLNALLGRAAHSTSHLQPRVDAERFSCTFDWFLFFINISYFATDRENNALYAQKARICLERTAFYLSFNFSLNFRFSLELPFHPKNVPLLAHIQTISFTPTNAAEYRLVSTKAVWLYAALLAQHSLEWRTINTSSGR